ncbi:hypothetical protein [Streptomyces sp. NPDC088554]|uniref:hypothetical protein n=1 Tax=Streptomyces sp. NPDC088554 TaxID=3365865 RepID=UPI00380BE543
MRGPLGAPGHPAGTLLIPAERADRASKALASLRTLRTLRTWNSYAPSTSEQRDPDSEPDRRPARVKHR